MACSSSSKNLRDLYDNLSLRFRSPTIQPVVDKTSKQWKEECVTYVKNLERLFDATVHLSQEMKKGLGKELLDCLKTTDDRLFRETDRLI